MRVKRFTVGMRLEQLGGTPVAVHHDQDGAVFARDDAQPSVRASGGSAPASFTT